MTDLTLGRYGFKEIDSYVTNSQTVTGVNLDVNTNTEDSRVVVIIGTSGLSSSTNGWVNFRLMDSGIHNISYVVTSTGETSTLRSSSSSRGIIHRRHASITGANQPTGRRVNWTMHISFGSLPTTPITNTVAFSDASYWEAEGTAAISSSFLGIRSNDGFPTYQVQFYPYQGYMTSPAIRVFALCSLAA